MIKIDSVKNKAVIIFILITSSLLSGCFGEEEKPESRFSWPEFEDIACDISNIEEYQCDVFLDGFNTPVKTLIHPNNSELWIADLTGEIYSWDGEEKQLVANLTSIISTCHNEQGLLGFTFLNSSGTDNKILLSYTEKVSCSGEEGVASLVLSEATIVNGNVDINTINVLRTIEQPERNHNGGSILSIGGNQFLWSVGDGGGSNDPDENGQNKYSHLGTIQYFEYQNNTVIPILDTYGNDTDFILHYGLRNPWKFDVDDMGRIWIADVGQYCFEEINMVELLNQSNFGWSEREGMHDFGKESLCDQPKTEPPQNVTDPIIEYSHDNGDCSVTGGYWMDWGPISVQDSYLYGDFCSGSIWLAKQNNGDWVGEEMVNIGTMIVGFGRGLNDELLIFSWSGSIYHLSEKE
jgi:glucose/arabinose dehydrogenase